MALSKYEQKTNHMLSPGEGNTVVKCDGKCLICDFNDPNFGCTYPSSKVKIGRTPMDKEILKELRGMLEDINLTEIASHFEEDRISWLMNWQSEMKRLLAFLTENYTKDMAELDKLRRENFGLKTTVKNQREKLNKFYRNH